MIWVFVCVLTIILVEFFLRLPLVSTARGVVTTGQKAAKVMASKGASDHWKEKALQAYSGKMLKASLILAAGLGVIAGVGFVLTAGAEIIWPGATVALLSWTGLILSLVVAIVYMFGRNKFMNRAN